MFFIFRRDSPNKIGGQGSIVEVDEAKLSKIKFKFSRVVRSPWIQVVDILKNEMFLKIFFLNQEKSIVNYKNASILALL